MNRSGMVYMLALVAVLVIAGSAMVMARGTAEELQQQRRLQERAACRLAAEGLLRALVVDLDDDLGNGALPALDQIAVDGEAIGDCLVYLVGRDPAAREPRFGLIPLAARVDLNNSSFEVLARLPDIDEALAAAIIDWRDSDSDTHEAGGAESGDGWYASARQPYAPRNAAFENLGELRLLRGMDDERYFGEDINRNGLLDSGEDSDGDGQLDVGLRDRFALELREPAAAPDGSPRLSVTDLGRNFRSFLIGMIGEERGNLCYTQALSLQPFRSRLEFLGAIEFSDEEVIAIWPFLAGDEGRLGLIDAWSCSEDLLVALLGRDLADDIIAARPATRPGDPLWLVRGLDRAAAQQVGALFTNGCYRFQADILAVHRSGRSWYRLDAEIDCSGAVARVLRLQRVDRDGWPLAWVDPNSLARQADELEQILGNPR